MFIPNFSIYSVYHLRKQLKLCDPHSFIFSLNEYLLSVIYAWVLLPGSGDPKMNEEYIVLHSWRVQMYNR